MFIHPAQQKVKRGREKNSREWGWGKRERERQTDRDRDKDRDRQTAERQRNRETEKQTDRQTETDKQTDRHTERQTGRQMEINRRRQKPQRRWYRKSAVSPLKNTACVKLKSGSKVRIDLSCKGHECIVGRHRSSLHK